MGITRFIRCRETIVADANPALSCMWQTYAYANVAPKPPTEVSYEKWLSLKNSSLHTVHRTFVGFACSFGGKFFSSYARPNNTTDSYAGVGARSVERICKRLRSLNAKIYCHDVNKAPLKPGKGWLVYCDPPYKGVASYSEAPSFDHAAFWKTAEKWSRLGAEVFVSEFNAPPSWTCVLQLPYTQRIKRGEPIIKTEKIFRFYS